MCSIVGFVGELPKGCWRQTHLILGEQLIASMVRGIDATGFFAVTDPYRLRRTPKTVSKKRPVAADRFIKSTPSWRGLGRCSVVLAHTRFATHGSPTDALNNHPHVSENGRYALVHNGVIQNYLELARLHGLRLTSQCDSEVLLRLIERAHHPADGLKTCLRECRGSIAVAVYDAKRHVVWLARNEGRPLVLCKLRRRPVWFFASTAEILLRGLRRAFRDAEDRIEIIVPLAANAVTALTPDVRLLAQEGTTL